MTEVEQPPPQNGIDLSANEDDDHNISRPADIEQDMREMERRKRVEAIMGSKLFREELERIVDSARDGSGTTGILQQLSDIVGLPAARIGSTYKASNCLMPINDIRGVESMGYAKGEKILRSKLAATFRLLDLYGWTQGLGAQITARLKVDQEYFLVNPYGLLYHEITASSLNKVDMQGNIVEQGTTNFGVNKSHFVLHSVVHAARPDIRCAIYIGCSPVVAVSSLKAGLLPITRDACVLGEITTHAYTGILDNDERDRLIRNLGPNSKVMLLTNHGALCCGETIEEAFYAACHIVQACETQLKLLPVGLDNLSLIPEESRKAIYEQARRPPEDLEKKFAAASANDTQDEHNTSDAAAPPKIGQAPKWRVGGAEFEALMRMLDNAGYRTGYIYRHPLIKSDPPKPKNDVELPPAVSSLGYLLEEEELFKQGIWKKGDLRKGGDRSRWLNSPNVYQKVEVLETGTPDPKKITKWVAEGSPSHSTPVRIEDALQFVPAGTNPKEFKRLQQQIKDNRRADKISAGPQSHILEGVTWDEANRIRDASVSATGDHVVLMGAASKGIIQRGFQHNATVYKAPYAKNPFDNVTDDELNEYKRTVERKKKSIHGEYTDTDFSESEALSSLPPGQQGKHGKRAGAQSEPEDMGAHQVMRIETIQAPKPSQPEVVLSDATLSFINGERSHTAVNRKPPTGRALNVLEIRRANFIEKSQHQIKQNSKVEQRNKASQANEEELQHEARKIKLIQEMQKVPLFQEQKEKFSANMCSEEHEHEEAAKQLVVNERKRELVVLDDKLGQSSLNNNDSSVSDTSQKQRLAAKALVALSKAPAAANWSKNTFFMPFMAVAAASKFQQSQQQRNKQTQVKYTRRIELSQQQQQQQLLYDNAPPLVPYNTLSDSCDSTTTDTRAEPSASCSSMNFCCNYFGNDSNDASFESFGENENAPPTLGAPKFSLVHSAGGVRLHAILSQCNHAEPYRTVSHFGFNSPRQLKQPEHKHLPTALQATTSTIYKPLRKTQSLGEIFALPQLSEFCDTCFEKALSCKSNWGPVKLQNITDEDENEDECGGDAYVDIDDENASSEPIYDYVYANRPLLEPLIEVDETKIVPPPNEDDKYATADSSFLEKIMRLNYSEESTNVCFTPHPITSSISINVGDDDTANGLLTMMDESNMKIKNLQTATNGALADITTATDSSALFESLSIDCTNLPAKVCITEIIDFGNWQQSGLVAGEATSQVNKPFQVDAMIAENGIDTIDNKQSEAINNAAIVDDFYVVGQNLNVESEEGSSKRHKIEVTLQNTSNIMTVEQEFSKQNDSKPTSFPIVELQAQNNKCQKSESTISETNLQTLVVDQNLNQNQYEDATNCPIIDNFPVDHDLNSELNKSQKSEATTFETAVSNLSDYQDLSKELESSTKCAINGDFSVVDHYLNTNIEEEIAKSSKSEATTIERTFQQEEESTYCQTVDEFINPNLNGDSEEVIKQSTSTTSIVNQNDSFDYEKECEEIVAESLYKAVITKEHDIAAIGAENDFEEISERASDSSLKRTMKNLCNKMVKLIKHDKPAKTDEEYVDQTVTAIGTLEKPVINKEQPEDDEKDPTEETCLNAKHAILGATAVFYVAAGKNEMMNNNLARSKSVYKQMEDNKKYVEQNVIDDDKHYVVNETNGECCIDEVDNQPNSTYYVDQEYNFEACDEKDFNNYVEQDVESRTVEKDELNHQGNVIPTINSGDAKNELNLQENIIPTIKNGDAKDEPNHQENKTSTINSGEVKDQLNHKENIISTLDSGEVKDQLNHKENIIPTINSGELKDQLNHKENIIPTLDSGETKDEPNYQENKTSTINNGEKAELFSKGSDTAYHTSVTITGRGVEEKSEPVSEALKNLLEEVASDGKNNGENNELKMENSLTPSLEVKTKHAANIIDNNEAHTVQSIKMSRHASDKSKGNDIVNNIEAKSSASNILFVEEDNKSSSLVNKEIINGENSYKVVAGSKKSWLTKPKNLYETVAQHEVVNIKAPNKPKTESEAKTVDLKQQQPIADESNIAVNTDEVQTLISVPNSMDFYCEQKTPNCETNEKSDLCYYVDQEEFLAKSKFTTTDESTLEQLKTFSTNAFKALTISPQLPTVNISPITPLKTTHTSFLPSLMTRDERFKRKSEFQELWEDHVAFFNGKNQQENSDDDFDGNKLKAAPQIINSTLETEILDEEVFYGQSSIYYLNPTNTTKQYTDEDIEDGRESSTTFNVENEDCSEQRIPRNIEIENLFEIKSAYNLENDMQRFKYLQRNLFNGKEQQTTSDECDYDAVDIVVNDLDDAKSELNSQERAIIKGIRDNNLKQRHDGEIFAKIENSIINKLTPRRMAELLNRQRRQQKENSSEDSSSPRVPQVTKPRRSRSRQLRRNRNSTLLLDDYTSPIANITSSVTTPPPRPKKNVRETISNKNKCTISTCSSTKETTYNKRSISQSSTSPSICGGTVESNKVRAKHKTSTSKRDFIRENIKNAGKTGSRRQLQHQQQRETPKQLSFSISSTKLARQEARVPEVEVFQSVTSASIYPFQTKVVHGSPLLWVSLSPQRCKSESHFKKSKPLMRQRILKRTAVAGNKKTEDEQPSCSKTTQKSANITPTQSTTKIDLALDALNDKMLAINTRLESIQRKDEDFAKNLNKCAHIVDECSSLQREVATEQQKLQQDIAMNQYAEEILCRTQTYSLSATED